MINYFVAQQAALARLERFCVYDTETMDHYNYYYLALRLGGLIVHSRKEFYELAYLHRSQH